MCSCRASVSPDSQTATKRSSPCGHKRQSIGREINSTNLLLDNTMRGWRKRGGGGRKTDQDAERTRDWTKMRCSLVAWDWFVCSCRHESMQCTSPTNDPQLGLSLSYLTETNQRLAAHYLHFMHEGLITSPSAHLRLATTFIIELGVCDLHLRQPLCMRVCLHNQTRGSICSPRDDEEFGRSGRGGSPLIWLDVAVEHLGPC